MEQVAIDVLKFLLSKKHESSNGLPSVNHIFIHTPTNHIPRIIEDLEMRKYATFKINTLHEPTSNQNFGWRSIGTHINLRDKTKFEITLNNVPIEGQLLKDGEDWLDEHMKHEKQVSIADESNKLSKQAVGKADTAVKLARLAVVLTILGIIVSIVIAICTHN